MGAAPEVELLSWATSRRVIDEHDRELLVGLAEAACEVEVSHSREGRGGLCSRSGSSVVAARHGISEATFRRRARRSIRALADAGRAVTSPQLVRNESAEGSVVAINGR